MTLQPGSMLRSKKKKAKNEMKQGATLSPSQTRLASLVDFFSPLLMYFSTFCRHCGGLSQATDVRIH